VPESFRGEGSWPLHYDVANSDLAWQYKGWPRFVDRANLQTIGDEGLNIFADDFMFPVMCLAETALNHNMTTLARFCSDNEVSLAPHGKTTMSPELIHRQLDAGAWAIAASTASQARIFRAFGVPRILIAHQVVDPAAVRWIWDELQANPDVEMICLVDSVEGVEVLESALTERSDGRPIDALVELGIESGRTGCRTVDEAIAVAQRISASSRLRLVGAEGYEGILPFQGDDFSKVDTFLTQLKGLTERLSERGLFDHLDEVVVTAGGSMFPDRVVAILGGKWNLGRRVRVVIRPGGYVTHDSIHYEESGPFGVRPPMDSYPALQPALSLWSYVVSRPEAGLALLGFGKRDVSYDIDLPIPVSVRRDGQVRHLNGELNVFELNDQHAFVLVPDDFDLAVGDVVECGISHPCASFDRWRAMPIVDDEYNVIGAVRTFF
jgi:D-serine deaminase-like pyridoxal phosphate-dependent protein